MYFLDTGKIQAAIKDKGFGSISGLALSLGIHRNTLQHYFSGAPLISEKLEQTLQTLGLKLQNVITEKKTSHQFDWEPIAPLVDALHTAAPNLTFILFGSRTKNTSRKYSDWDIGVYSSANLAHKDFRKLLCLKTELEESLPFSVDLVNLNNADDIFIKNIAHTWIFLTGKLKDWLAINKRV